jgi:D-glycero-alpha-D-manno-heptose-7-phosphate kinase
MEQLSSRMKTQALSRAVRAPVTVEATAPSRIDLAGGTLDIYPLYLFEDGGITINAAITVGSHVRITTHTDRRVRLISHDTGEVQEGSSAEQLRLGGPLDLVARAVRFYSPPTGMTVETRNDAPKGSGLGASSSLLIAISGALRALTGNGISNMTLVQHSAQLEAQSVRVPTGRQDYYPAIFGGVNAIWFDIEGDTLEPLGVGEAWMSEFEERLVLCFTGETRFSGASNWNMLKMYIDDGGTTQANMAAIKRTAVAMREAFLRHDFDRVTALLDEEWENRRRLADGVSTPQLERLMAAAREAGAMASRVCGAGGGGCMISLCGPGTQGDVACALDDNGATRIPCRIARSGLDVRIVEA